MRGTKLAAALLLTVIAHATYAMEIVATVPDVPWPSPVVPVTVTLTTEAETRSGAVVIRDGTFHMRIPVDMPPNTTRELSFPLPRNLRNYQMYFDGGGLPQQIQAPSPEYGRTELFVTIGDTPGMLNVLQEERTTEDFVNSRTATWHWEPGKVPLQPAVLMGIEAVTLGDGAERLKDEEVRALRDYVLLGGTLVIPGGAAATVARDPRWSAWLPASLGDPVVLPASDLGFAGSAQSQFTVRSMSLNPDAVAQSRFVARKAFGIGAVVLTGFDLLETNLRADSKFKEQFRVIAAPVSDRIVNNAQFSGGYVAEPGETFRVRPPGFWQIFGWLLAYILIVGPINFLVLSKLKRKELAWFTAPILSVAFAGVVVAQSQVRRTTGAAHAVEGIVVADSTSNRAIISGQQLLFFPDGGRYDLKMPNVTSVWFGGGRNDNPLAQIAGNRGIFADGIVYSTHYDFSSVMAKSLAYEQFYFVQEIERPLQVWAHIDRISQGVFNVTVRNQGAEPLRGVSVNAVSGVRSSVVAENLVPGEEVRKEIQIRENEQTGLSELLLSASIQSGGAEVGRGESNLRYQQVVLVGGKL
ncbi:MAG: hypothetical protein KF812_00435 [Fimbriimonadaceae bacterium]|nr:hypothetical protein [Fimbriimonadaceae bacterium]